MLTPLITETPSIIVARSSITVSFTIFTPFEIKVMHTMANTPLITGVGSEVMTAMSFGQNPRHTRMAPPAMTTRRNSALCDLDNHAIVHGDGTVVNDPARRIHGADCRMADQKVY